MRYGLGLPAAGSWGDPRTIAELACLAERSGWDGVFVEDYVFFHDGGPTYDPWVALAAVALATDRIRLGTMVTPVPGRRVWKLAAEAMTIDHLSRGRMILGVGLGGAIPAVRIGEVAEKRTRASILDESLDVLALQWSGESVTYRGTYVHIEQMRLRPTPVQRPRIPIWVGGSYERRGPRERAVRWDGSILFGVSPQGRSRDLTPENVQALHAAARAQGNDEFVVAVGGRQRRDDLAAETAYVSALARSGADWWHEYIEPTTALDTARERIASGPIRAGDA